MVLEKIIRKIFRKIIQKVMCFLEETETKTQVSLCVGCRFCWCRNRKIFMRWPFIKVRVRNLKTSFWCCPMSFIRCSPRNSFTRPWVEPKKKCAFSPKKTFWQKRLKINLNVFRRFKRDWKRSRFRREIRNCFLKLCFHSFIFCFFMIGWNTVCF